MKKPVAKKPARPVSAPTQTDRLVEKQAEIAGKLRELRNGLNLRNKDMAASLGRGVEAIKKMMSGGSVKGYAKLALLSELLRTTPNDILGFSGGFERQRLQGALEAILIAQGQRPARAAAIAEVVLQALSQPPEGSPDIDAVSTARIQIETVIRQALRLPLGTEPGA